MLEARSVAVVGASARPGSFGEQLMIQLVGGGFDGAIYPVNPRYDEVMGHLAYASLGVVPEPMDLVLLGVPNGMLEAQLRVAADAGARSAVIFASCYEPPREGAPPLGERLARIAREAGMALCGGNGMGFLNVERRLRACGFPEPESLEPGGITFISHSGSAFSAMLHNDRGLRFNLVVSSGLELVTTGADYMEHALSLDSTGAIALFIETARAPDRFRRALSRAAERDVPVVALKVGREPESKRMVASHTGALAGEDEAYQAVFDAHGVIRVETLDEMADTLELFAAERRAGPGGLASIHDSGGERAHVVDLAPRAGVRFARISARTRERLAEELEEGLEPGNPLDAWGTGNDADEIFIACMRTLLDDPDTAAMAFCVDFTSEISPDAGYVRVAREVFEGTTKPFAVLSNLSSAIDARDAAAVRAAGIPVLEGTATGLAAFAHLFAYRDFRARPAGEPTEPVAQAVRERWRAKLTSGDLVGQSEALALLEDYSIPVIRAWEADTEEAALAAAERIGRPVAVKTASPGAPHKTDRGGVRLGLSTPQDVSEAYRDVAGRLGPKVVVQEMAPPGVELALGVVRDDQFGPLVMAGAGGTLVEVLADRRFAVPPLDDAAAARLLASLAVKRLLDGARGVPPSDVASVAGALAALSRLAADLGDDLDELDVNPLIAGPEGCIAVDALVVPRRRP